MILKPIIAHFLDPNKLLYIFFCYLFRRPLIDQIKCDMYFIELFFREFSVVVLYTQWNGFSYLVIEKEFHRNFELCKGVDNRKKKNRSTQPWLKAWE